MDEDSLKVRIIFSFAFCRLKRCRGADDRLGFNLVGDLCVPIGDKVYYFWVERA